MEHCRHVHLRNDMGAPIPTDGDARQHWIKFYSWQLRKIREFAIKHPSLTYLEIHPEKKEHT